MIWYLPLERLDKRYTHDMDTLLKQAFEASQKPYTTIEGDELTTDIAVGAFLDANGTNYYKFSQLQKVCQLFADKKVQDGDIFFCSDLWFPGIESIGYMAYFNKRLVKLAGVLHAGSWTETDFVANMKDWAKHYEKMLSQMSSYIFFGSDWSKQEFIDKSRAVRYDNMYVTGIPFDPELCYKRVPYKPWRKKKDLIVFNGRLHDEKQPWRFDMLARQIPRYEWVKTMDQDRTKKEYYELLSDAKVVFSAALQENFGFGILEACAYGCRIVVPDRLSYETLYPREYRYDSDHEALLNIASFMSEKTDPQDLIQIARDQAQNARKIVDRLL